MIKISDRGAMSAFLVMDTMARANQMVRDGKTVYRFEVGQPQFDAPQKVLDMAKTVIDTQKISYTEPMGVPALREAIATHYKDVYNADVAPSQIVITPGSSGAFSLAFLSCFEHGDRVALAMPCYPSYKRILESFGVEIVPILATEDDKYFPTPALLCEALKGGKIDGLIVASPNNPTGTTLTPKEFKELMHYCDSESIRVISDELYHGVEFSGNTPVTAFTENKDALIINSFSKYYCMTGWRLGWMIVPKNMITVINNLQSNMFISAPKISQVAAIECFKVQDELDANVHRYKENRDLFVKELTAMGITKFAYPEGGFYLYADISHLTDNSLQWANDLLENANVAVSSGMDFDSYRGHHTVRFSYVCDTQHAKDGLNALRKYIEQTSEVS